MLSATREFGDDTGQFEQGDAVLCPDGFAVVTDIDPDGVKVSPLRSMSIGEMWHHPDDVESVSDKEVPYYDHAPTGRPELPSEDE